MSSLASPFHIILKPRGAICNLDCAYCYFLSKERLYPGSQFRMADDLLEEYTRQYIATQPAPEAIFAWQGGEPTLMGLSFFQRAIELQEKYRRPGMRILNTLQTNGTTLDETWCRFLHQHRFLVGLSLDGPRALHDAYRRDKGGRPTFDRVMAGLALLQRYGVDFNILTTVHAANASQPLAVYRFLRDEVGARFIQFILIVERDNAAGFQEGERVTERSVTGRDYGKLLIEVFEEWVRRDVGQVSTLYVFTDLNRLTRGGTWASCASMKENHYHSASEKAHGPSRRDDTGLGARCASLYDADLSEGAGPYRRRDPGQGAAHRHQCVAGGGPHAAYRLGEVSSRAEPRPLVGGCR